jgi:hypothetical protein
MQQNKKLHPLQCPQCEEYRYLVFKKHKYVKTSKVLSVDIPYFDCHLCNTSQMVYGQSYWKKAIQDKIQQMPNGGIVELSRQPFEKYRHLELQYDPNDYYYISGLYREWDDGYLTPVFFDMDVLLYYNNHPDYAVRLSSFSSGNIYIKKTGEPLFEWGFGVNRSGKVFKWLGDLAEDFDGEGMLPHLKLFQARNVPSDHDIVSKFYFMQIPHSTKDAFTDSDNEYKLFEVKNKLEDELQKKYEMILSKFTVDLVSSEYKHPILNDKDQIFTAYTKLNKLLVENIEPNELKKKLKDFGVSKEELKDVKTMKLLKMFLSKVSTMSENDVESIISPLFVLNDLRQLDAHLSITGYPDKYNYCKDRLKLLHNASDFEVFRALIEALINFYQTLLEKL